MKLGVRERIVFGALLPKQGDLITINIAKDITDKVALTKDEIENLEIKTNETGGFTWKTSADIEKEFNFDKRELELLKDQVDALNKEKKIDFNILTLCQKIKEENR